MPSDVDLENVEESQAVVQLTENILKGKTPSVLRKIKAAYYVLDIDAIRRVLKSLRSVGILEDDKRNSYKLDDAIPFLLKRIMFYLRCGAAGVILD